MLFCAAPLAAQNASVDVLHYRLEIDIPAAVDEITAAAELTVRPLVTPLATLDLDFGALTVDGVEIDGAATTFERADNKLKIALGDRGKSREPFRARIRYHGKPKDGLFLQENKHGVRGVFADNWPNRARHWFPGVDHPADKATVEMIVTAPARFDVVANGALVETASAGEGRKRTHWRETATIPVHCMVVGAAEFTIVRAGGWDGVEVLYYLYPQDREHGITELGRTQQMLEYFSTLVGPYPYEKLALVESSTRFGGMENASAIFLDEKRFDGKGSMEGLAAHEIAHQWFGDSVSQAQWHDLWLSEGFAKYFERLFLAHVSGHDAFVKAMEADRQEYLAAYKREPRAIHDPTPDLFKLLNPMQYEKGSWVLHMLRAMMGDKAFFAGIREYYAAHRDRNASTADFRLVMERHARQPLDWFFRQWIFEPGHPVYALAWSWSAGKVAIDVEQKQPGTVYRMPVAVEVRGEGFAKRETVLIDERRERFEIASEQQPEAVVLDPEEVVLKEMERK